VKYKGSYLLCQARKSSKTAVRLGISLLREQLSSFGHLRNTRGHDFIARYTGDIPVFLNHAALLRLDESYRINLGEK
jgi:hypothetical protein